MSDTVKCDVCGKEYRNLAVHKNMAHKAPETPEETVARLKAEEEAAKDKSGPNPGPDGPTQAQPDVMGMLNKMMGIMDNMDKRIGKFETKERGDQFKTGIKAEDIDAARATREGVDTKIAKLVDETLGEDFKIEITPRGDQPGFLFTLIVPSRLSDMQPSSRPVRDPEGKGYLKTPEGTNVEEEYIPDDRRSRAISSYQSYDAIREHCERVRSYIVAYYQKMQKPIPEFKLKQYNV